MITHEQAREALDSLDDLARMDVGVDAIGARGTLELYIAERAEEPQRREEMEIATAQAVEFAEYILKIGTGPMIVRAQRFLSLPYSQELAARMKRVPA